MEVANSPAKEGGNVSTPGAYLKHVKSFCVSLHRSPQKRV